MHIQGSARLCTAKLPEPHISTVAVRNHEKLDTNTALVPYSTQSHKQQQDHAAGLVAIKKRTCTVIPIQ